MATTVGVEPKMNDWDKKIAICMDWYPPHLRFGWSYALRSLTVLHNPAGIAFDGYIEQTFLNATEHSARPYKHPWVGVLHHPPNVPHWFGSGISVLDIVRSTWFQESLEYCKGIFVLSFYLRDFLEKRVPVPINTILHPTGPALRSFTMHNFRACPEQQLVHVGWWLRKFHSFFTVRTGLFQKVLLLPCRGPQSLWPSLVTALRFERLLLSQNPPSPCKVAYYVSDLAYDELLSRSPIFLDLYDGSANNIVVECIMRSTPLIVRRHPAIVDYLGPEYPLYFETLEQAESLMTEESIEEGHNYLANSDLAGRLSSSAFVRTVAESQIYSMLSC